MNVIFDDNFEWDDSKDSDNQDAHDGLTFEEARLIWDGPVYVLKDRRQYPETRWLAFGYLDPSTLPPQGGSGQASSGQATLLIVVFTWRGQRKRIISAREAEAHEKAKYGPRIPHNRRRA